MQYKIERRDSQGRYFRVWQGVINVSAFIASQYNFDLTSQKSLVMPYNIGKRSVESQRLKMVVDYLNIPRDNVVRMPTLECGHGFDDDCQC